MLTKNLKILGKIENLSTPEITIYRLVYPLVPPNYKNYRDPTFGQIFGLISKSGSMFHKLARKNTHETIGDSPARTGVRLERGVPVRKISSPREVLL